MSCLLLCQCAHSFLGADLKKAPRGRTFTQQGEYIIGVNDKLSIQVLGGNDVNSEFTVSQMGTIGMPLIGAERAAGLTERMLAKKLTERYANFIKNPVVSVGVIGYESYKVFITGDVRRPGPFVFQERTTLLQGIASAGGLGDFAKGTIIVHRIGRNGAVERFKAEYDEVLAGENHLDGFLLERGDVVHVY